MIRTLSATLLITLLSTILVTGHTRDTPRPIDSYGVQTPSMGTDTTENPLPISPIDTVLESTTVTLAWTVTQDSSYMVEIRGGIADTLESEGYEITIALDTGTYDWRVRGVDSSGPGAASEWVTFRVREPFGVPTLLSPIDDTLTAGDVEFVWSGDWEGEFEWQISGDSVRSMVTTDTSITVGLDTGSYHWRVRATADGTGGAWSDSVPLTIIPVADLPVVTPLAPLNKTVGTGIIRLVWISDWRNSFVVELRGDTTMTATVKAYFLEVDLESEGSYEWRIRAVDGSDLGPWSAWWRFSTSDDITGVEETEDTERRLDIQ